MSYQPLNEYMNDLISIIIPTFNRSSTVGVSIRSILEQKMNVEIIVVDDGSTDDTMAIISKFHDDRIRCFRQENCGSSAARANGVKHATGDWVLFLDSDDYLLPGMLETLMRLTNEESAPDFVFCECWFEDMDSSVRTEATILPDADGFQIARFIVTHSQCYNCRFLVKLSTYRAVGGYDPEIRMGAPELMVFVPLFCRFKFARTIERLAVIRNGAANRLSRKPMLVFEGWSKVIQKLMANDDIRKVIAPVLASAKGQQLLCCGEMLYNLNKFAAARTIFLKSIISYPTILTVNRKNPFVYIVKSYIRQLLGLRIKTY